MLSMNSTKFAMSLGNRVLSAKLPLCQLILVMEGRWQHMPIGPGTPPASLSRGGRPPLAEGS